MANITPVGSATPTGNLPPSFPLMPLGWPLTIVPGSDPVTANKQPQTPNPASAAQTALIVAELAFAGNTGNRLA
jgi:hypothetical protein